MARGDILALFPGKRGIVDREKHGDGGLVHGDARQGLRIFGVRDRIADAHTFDARKSDDIADGRFLCIDALQALELKERGDLGFHNLIALLNHADRVGYFYGTRKNPANGQTSDIIIVIDVHNQELERPGLVTFRRWNSVYY